MTGRILGICMALASICLPAAAQDLDTTILGKEEILEKIENLPNVEIGRGVTFRPKNDFCELTIRFRMQNMVGLHFNDRFSLSKTDAQVKRLRLRFDGYLYSPKIIYSIQLGFTGNDARLTPNGKTNIIQDAVIYYKPDKHWNIGFGQAKVKTNRAHINSSGALQFVDKSIVNKEFGGERGVGIFGEYHLGSYEGFAMSTLAAVTLGEGRNWGSSEAKGFAYSARLEFFPFGKFHSKGEYVEGDLYGEKKFRMMIGGGYTFNHNARMNQGMRGVLFPKEVNKNIGSYYADLIMKYRGFSLNADYMGRYANSPETIAEEEYGIYCGSGINVQASYLFDKKWELALRNSTLMPEEVSFHQTGYKRWNQSTVGISRYIFGHSLKVQLDVSYNHFKEPVSPHFDRWGLRLQVELGL